MEERRKLQRETLEQNQSDPEKVKAQEVEPDQLASSLEKDIDHMKVLKIKEAKLKKQLRLINERKKRLRSRILRRL